MGTHMPQKACGGQKRAVKRLVLTFHLLLWHVLLGFMQFWLRLLSFHSTVVITDSQHSASVCESKRLKSCCHEFMLPGVYTKDSVSDYRDSCSAICVDLLLYL